MKRLFKIFLPAFFLCASLFLVLPTKTQAQQGTYQCTWALIGDCAAVADMCAADYMVPTNFDCSQYKTQQECEQLRTCILDPTKAFGKCSYARGSGTLVNNCQSGYIPQISGAGVCTCVNPAGTTGATCPGGINTAVGCIPTSANDFVAWFLRWAIGIGGGIAFLLILWSGFQIMTSSGNPERLKGGQEQLTAAISGLLFIILSVVLLRLIGVQILHLPGFGG